MSFPRKRRFAAFSSQGAKKHLGHPKRASLGARPGVFLERGN
jgi:hypothetical protein